MVKTFEWEEYALLWFLRNITLMTTQNNWSTKKITKCLIVLVINLLKYVISTSAHEDLIIWLSEMPLSDLLFCINFLNEVNKCQENKW